MKRSGEIHPFEQISGFPTVHNGVHESVYKAYQVLERVKVMLERGDSRETILEIIKLLEDHTISSNASRYPKDFLIVP